MKEVKLKDFQFKLNNKILASKSFLLRINKIDNNLCSYCGNNPETLMHLFVDCQKVKAFWRALRLWLQRHANLKIDILNHKNLIFSWHKENSLSNNLLVVAKYYIYKTKFTSRQLSMAGFKQLLKRKFENEKYTAKINNKYVNFLSKWSALYNQLNIL